MEKNRLEAFSDGVLAIIITIMVLEFDLPDGDKLADILKSWETVFSYLISFFFIAIYWVNHHYMMHSVKTVNNKILWCNIIWLFVMSFIPFCTAWVGKYPTSFAPLAVYFVDMFLACISFHLMYYFVVKEIDENILFKLGPRSIISIITYFLAAVLGGFAPFVTYAAVILVSLSWAIPHKTKGKELYFD